MARALVEKGSFVKTEVNFKTPLGWRRADIAVYEDEGLTKVLYLVETKAGISRYLPLQRFKDAYLETVRGIPVTVVTAP